MSGGIGIKGIGTIPIVRKGASFGMPPWDFNPNLVTFTPGMAKRATSVFAASPIVQGKFGGIGQSDLLSAPAGSLVAGSAFTANMDTNQGSICFRIVPEWNGNDGLEHTLLIINTNDYIYKSTGNLLFIVMGLITMSVSAAAWVAGTAYNVCIRWDSKNTLDGTNYACISINDTHTFGGTITNSPTVSSGLNFYNSTLSPINAIIEGLTIYRRVLYDGTYGVDVGNGDEVNLISAGIDPTTVTGSWDVVFCLPTNATAGALVTGTGEAWSHPHSSNLLTRGFLSDRYYGGGQWGVKFNGTTTYIGCGSDVGLDDLPNNAFTAECWYKSDFVSLGSDMLKKGQNATGWMIRVTNASISCVVAFAGGWIIASDSSTPSDGKWHHVAMTYDNAGDKKTRIYVDGKYKSVSAAASGAYTGDAADNFVMSFQPAGGGMYTGSIGWTRISNNKRYADGVDFVPVRTPPAPDANTLAQWNMAEGTGVTVDNVGSIGAAADGTITNGTWEPQWYDEGTPVRLRSVVGTSLYKSTITAAASINDLHDGAFTIDGWIMYTGAGFTISEKNKWSFYINGTGYVFGSVVCATTNAYSQSANPFLAYTNSKTWHYLKMTFDDAGDRKIRLYVDNVEVTYTTQTAGVDAIVSDAAFNATIGGSGGATMSHGWIRWSNVVRGAGMIPRSNPPDPADANTVLQFNADEGAGAVLTDLSGEGNNAAMAGTYSWNNSPAMESDSPGARNYAWGYVFGTDAANEGFKQTISGSSAGQDFVLRALAYTEDGLGIPGLVVRDETNGFDIKTVLGTTGSSERKPDLLMCSFELPTTARYTGTSANCSVFSVKMINALGTGSVIGFQQVELLANLLDNPSLDTGAVADPWIPYGWTNNGIDAGDTEIETTIVHSGGACIQANVGALSEEIYMSVTAAANKYLSLGAFVYNSVLESKSQFGDLSQGRLWHQATLNTTCTFTPTAGTAWVHKWGVGRRPTDPYAHHVYFLDSAGTRYMDDFYIVLLDDVSLTVTPASAANSVESGGIRVDGIDFSPQNIPAGRLFANSGWIRWRYIPRHNGADIVKFGNAAPYIARAQGDANNYIGILWSAAGLMQLDVRSAGGAVVTTNWITAGAIVAGGNYLMEVRYTDAQIQLIVDGIVRMTAVTPIGFTTIPAIFYVGTPEVAYVNYHEDAVFLSP